MFEGVNARARAEASTEGKIAKSVKFLKSQARSRENKYTRSKGNLSTVGKREARDNKSPRKNRQDERKSTRGKMSHARVDSARPVSKEEAISRRERIEHYAEHWEEVLNEQELLIQNLREIRQLRKAEQTEKSAEEITLESELLVVIDDR